VWIGRRLRFPANADQQFLFGGETLRLFSSRRHSPETVSTAELSAVTPEAFSFVVFGDVTGAESPLHTRRAGYFAFRALARVVEEFRPRFAVSLGDLATHAARPAYARVRKFLRDIPVPLAVTPGNHDVVFRERYNAAHFHALFGPDNIHFRVGSVCFLLFNNAWGAVGEHQFAWMEKILREDTSAFRLVFCHKPLFDPREDECYAMEERARRPIARVVPRARGDGGVLRTHSLAVGGHARRRHVHRDRRRGIETGGQRHSLPLSVD
jgi:3',5'-cyclic AMP phosphodiesterase CpdA